MQVKIWYQNRRMYAAFSNSSLIIEYVYLLLRKQIEKDKFNSNVQERKASRQREGQRWKFERGKAHVESIDI